ncbi:interleukin-24 isoform X3 [Mesoplodon densirostris]|uniref:interleukin-24 isoform X3 n=1 Tax=Mesoplodon densirostris TaxID=48708 RepID=UPI0028DBA52F|nr:interleukin-24 isoform X3 [Mesoplodon densirostris]
MDSPVHMVALPCLSLILLFWSQGPGVQGQEFQFGPCQVEGVLLQELWEAFQAMKDIVEAESCYVIHALLKFYLNTVFKNYRDKAVEFRILKSFSTLANNFIVIVSKLQPSGAAGVMEKSTGSGYRQFWAQIKQEKEMFSISESARRRFLLFQRAFKQLDREAAVTKAFGEVDILLTWMENFYQL